MATPVLSLKNPNFRILTFTGNRNDFIQLLKTNPGIVVFKFTANWCGPCKSIKDYVEAKSNILPMHITIVEVDVDINFDVYSYLKHKRMVHGIPAFLCYIKGNDMAPIDSVVGANFSELDLFFQRVISIKVQIK